MLKRIIKNIVALSIGIVISFLLAELVLRVYNPLPSRFRGDKIQLKTNLKKKIVISPPITGLDSVIQYSVNSLGFRGEEKPGNPSYSIITVGGSTTECSMLDDEKTWTAVLGKKLQEINPQIWVNNAGLDGATTYGHNILLDDYILKLKPNMIVFLIGVNDRGKSDFSNEDGILINRRETFFKKLIKKSEVANLTNNLYMMYKTHIADIGHRANREKYQDVLEDVAIDSSILFAYKEKHKSSLSAYKERVEKLAEKCVQNSIVPVFATQPLVYGGEGWAIMQMYNDVVREVCSEKKIQCIDLANSLPKKAKYFYDEMHYTNEGAKAVSDIIYNNLKNKI